ncbi:MAG TPA: ribosome small subunit-dependent GTPase A [Ktedonobacteraceae bacterium]|nr:ribosome small subunit-dependent GTPase A [Ktedonobacteraceae bacterium]
MTNDLEMLTGMVLNGAHGIFDVHTDNGILRCTLRGKLKKSFIPAQTTRPLANANSRYERLATQARAKRNEENRVQPPRLSVGDYVKLRQLDATTGMIEEILPRQSELSRRDSASTEKKVMQQTLLANLDQVVLVFAVAQPDPHFSMLDRYLAICESAAIRPVICLNKADLEHEAYVEQAADLYTRLDYPVIWSSIITEQGIQELRSLLQQHMTLFTGPSGVGKSSLVNAIEPGMALKTGLISRATGKGKHTTTGSQLYPLSGGGWLADSAGIRALATWNIAPEELASCFIEFRPFLGTCEYSDCSHIDEEGCAILQAVTDGAIDEGRHRSYTRILLEEER